MLSIDKPKSLHFAEPYTRRSNFSQHGPPETWCTPASPGIPSMTGKPSSTAAAGSSRTPCCTAASAATAAVPWRVLETAAALSVAACLYAAASAALLAALWKGSVRARCSCSTTTACTYQRSVNHTPCRVCQISCSLPALIAATTRPYSLCML